MRTFLLAVLSLCTAAVIASAQTPEGFLAAPTNPDNSLLQGLLGSPTRTLIPLNGAWQFSEDGGDEWGNVTIPSSYLDPGEISFKRSFQIPAEMLKNYRWKLVCLGIQYQATITINGQFVAQHETGMPFSIMVPDEVKLSGNNTIQIDVANHLGYTSTVPGRKLFLGSRTYGGIFRDIVLVGVPRVWVDDARFQTTLSGGNGAAKFRVRVVSGAIRGMNITSTSDSLPTTVTLPDDKAEFELGVILRSPSGNDTIPPTEVGRGAQAFTLETKRTAMVDIPITVTNPALWAPGSPNLYDAVVQIRYKGALVDEQVLDVGFRMLESRGNQIFLNGQPIPMKGISYLEDVKENGASLSYEQMRRDMQSIKDMGVNLIRFPDGVPHPYLLQLCDEFGIMAMIDAPSGTPPSSLFSSESYHKRVVDRMRFAIEQGGKYTCVAAWGLNATIPDGDEGALALLRDIRKVVDSLDHRLLSFSASGWATPELRKLCDIPGINAFDVDIPQLTQKVKVVLAELNKERPLLLLAYGKFVQLENHGGYSDPISIEAQAKYISDIYGLIGQSGLAGGIYWAYNDYRTDRPLLTANNSEQYLATCGLYGLGRDLRQGALMLTALYTDQKTPDVPIGEYVAPSTIPFIAAGFVCAILFLLLINSSRRFRENVFRALLRPYNFFADIRDQRILSSFQTTVLGLVIAVTFAVIASSLCYYYRMEEGFDVVLTAIITSDSLKEFLNWIIWRPVLSMISFTMFFFVLLLVVAVLIRLCAAFVRNRIFFGDAYIIAIWGALPVLLLIPVAMVLYRLLEAPGAGIIAFSVMIGVLVWMLYRVLRGAAVVYDVRPLKVYGYAIGGIALLLLVLVVSSGEAGATLSYLQEGIRGLYSGG